MAGGDAASLKPHGRRPFGRSSDLSRCEGTRGGRRRRRTAYSLFAWFGSVQGRGQFPLTRTQPRNFAGLPHPGFGRSEGPSPTKSRRKGWQDFRRVGLPRATEGS